MKILIKVVAYSQDENGKYLNLEYMRSNLVESSNRIEIISALNEMINVERESFKSIES